MPKKRFGGEGAVQVAEIGEWTLFEFPGRGSPPWTSLKLDSRIARRAPGLLRSYWLGWNGERLADSSEARRLADERPDLHRLVVDELRTRA